MLNMEAPAPPLARSTAYQQPWWQKTLGSTEEPLEDLWFAKRPELLAIVRYPQRKARIEMGPSVRAGDRHVLYAAKWQRLIGVVLVMTDPRRTDGERGHDGRWPWLSEIKPLVVVPRISDAPSYSAVSARLGISVKQKSHLVLLPHEVDAVLDLFGSAALGS